MRVPGADINTHLALAACFASGLYGIKHKLSLPEPVSGNVTEAKSSERLPRSLRAAAERMGEDGSVAHDLFGKDFVMHFVKSRLEEVQLYEVAVTNFEIKRYFETV
jgi:glutamine synthetase